VVMVWGGSFTVIKLGLQDMPPMLLGCMRYLLSAFPALLWFARPKVALRWWLAYGLTVGVGQFAFLFLAVRHGLPAGVASVALQTQAFFTLVFARFFLHEPFRARQIVGLLVATPGLLLVATSAGASGAVIEPVAYLLVLASAVCWAGSNIVLNKAAASVKRSDFHLMGFIVWTSLVPPLPFALLSWLMGESWPLAWEAGLLSPLAWGSIVYLAVGGTLLGNGIFSDLMTRHPTGRIAPFTLLVPVFGLSLAALILHEQLSASQWLGCLLVGCGLAITVFGARWRVPAWHPPHLVRSPPR
jgi:O-acetylserine/cysteine efflux transporter